jgi:predicted acylesterase/phospholipase RssA
MAVCDVLKTNDRVEITKVAGTSAGAIAAVMLCSPYPMTAFKADLKRIGGEWLRDIKTHPWKGWFNVSSTRRASRARYLCNGAGDNGGAKAESW